MSTESEDGHQITSPPTPPASTSVSQLSIDSDERSALAAESSRLTSGEPISGEPNSGEPNSGEPMPNSLSTDAVPLSTEISEPDAEFQASQKVLLEKINMLQTRLEKLMFLQGSATSKQQDAISKQQSVLLAQQHVFSLLNAHLSVVEDEIERLNDKMAVQEDMNTES